ncbi:rCG44335 [Rattus norvegicus]|uniref:RCG44335 n=1 Tax=Rattus norvegicus TaxID=10116 RepID=A6KD73_RAT|nr:rCG44335 [Rattus norvegicus]
MCTGLQLGSMVQLIPGTSEASLDHAIIWLSDLGLWELAGTGISRSRSEAWRAHARARAHTHTHTHTSGPRVCGSRLRP